MLYAARQRGIPILISADAHAAVEITRHFAEARTLLSAAGYAKLARYERRRRVPVPL